MKLIIVSKDRACQLDALLCSMYRHEVGQNLEPHVIYVTTSDEFQSGYDIVEQEWGQVAFHKEGVLKDQIIDIIGKDNWGFSPDDSYFFKTPELTNFDELVEDVTCLSLRLGFNTVVQNCFADPILYQPPLSIYMDEGETISWDSSFYHPLYNYGYPFAFDCHLFNNKAVLPLLKTCQFTRPTELESEMVTKGVRYPKRIRSFKHSIYVNIPLNNISEVTQSLEGNLSDLNNLFLKGARLGFEKTEIKGCHQVVAQRFRYE